MDADLYQEILGQYRHGCVFCDPHPAIRWATGSNFAVCFDAAPLVPGHMIIFSKEHHACAAEVPGEHFDELDAVRAVVRDRIRAAWGGVTMYEHGRAGHCLSDGPEHRLCHHFHLHCVPGDADVGDELAARFQRVPVARYHDLPDLYAEYGNYLYLETDAGVKSYFAVNQEIERHLLRTLISKQVGHPERADWRAYADRHLLVDGQATLGPGPRL